MWTIPTLGNAGSPVFPPWRPLRGQLMEVPVRSRRRIPRQMKSLDVQELCSTRIPIGTETSVDNEQRASGDGSLSD